MYIICVGPSCVYALASTTSGTAPGPAERQRRPEVQVAGAEVVRGRALPLKSDGSLGRGELDASLGALPAHTRTDGARF